MEMWKEKKNEACRDRQNRETEIKRGTKRKRQGWEREKTACWGSGIGQSRAETAY